MVNGATSDGKVRRKGEQHNNIPGRSLITAESNRAH